LLCEKKDSNSESTSRLLAVVWLSILGMRGLNYLANTASLAAESWVGFMAGYKVMVRQPQRNLCIKQSWSRFTSLLLPRRAPLFAPPPIYNYTLGTLTWDPPSNCQKCCLPSQSATFYCGATRAFKPHQELSSTQKGLCQRNTGSSLQELKCSSKKSSCQSKHPRVTNQLSQATLNCSV
jgi:hypothetical protein